MRNERVMKMYNWNFDIISQLDKLGNLIAFLGNAQAKSICGFYLKQKALIQYVSGH